MDKERLLELAGIDAITEAKLTLTVPMIFTADDIQTILEGYNEMFIDEDEDEKPITLQEFAKNKKMQQYFIKEMQMSKDEIVEGSHEAMANDWLMDLKDNRIK